MMVTCHSNTLLSSTSPAEKPSTGFFERSASINIPQTIPPVNQTAEEERKGQKTQRDERKLRRAAGIRTFELLLEEETRLGGGGRHGGRSVGGG